MVIEPEYRFILPKEKYHHERQVVHLRPLLLTQMQHIIICSTMDESGSKSKCMA